MYMPFNSMLIPHKGSLNSIPTQFNDSLISKHSIHLTIGKHDRWTAEPLEPPDHIFDFIVSNIIRCICLSTERKLMLM